VDVEIDQTGAHQIGADDVVMFLRMARRFAQNPEAMPRDETMPLVVISGPKHRVFDEN
jgi:hypothetical protein